MLNFGADQMGYPAIRVVPGAPHGAETRREVQEDDMFISVNGHGRNSDGTGYFGLGLSLGVEEQNFIGVDLGANVAASLDNNDGGRVSFTPSASLQLGGERQSWQDIIR